MAKKKPNKPEKIVAKKLASPAKTIVLEEADEHRIPVLKTYKIYVNGAFPRTESGRYYLVRDAKGQPLANVCRCSRKDVRDAVVAARNAQSAWASRSGYNRSQILYRIAEMLEGRKAQFIDELEQLGVATSVATAEVHNTIDLLVYYAGWCDKYQQIFSSVNPVASSHFNFSVPEPTGVVAMIAPASPSLLGLVGLIAPAIAGGNTVIALASTTMPLCAVTLGEVLATSDLPGGVVNILTGEASEMLETMANHMDINAIVLCGASAADVTKAQQLASLNVKRVVIESPESVTQSPGPYKIAATLETKTTWHPVGT
jgi:acyl-CoA reductase-like NAD-dependent aldehyde dehydrogenase